MKRTGKRIKMVAVAGLALASFFSFVGSANAVPTPLPSGAVAWYPGNGNATDIVGGNNGTLANGAGFASGKVGQGFNFPNQGVVTVPDSNSLDLTAVTLEGWVSLNTAPSASADFAIATKGITGSSENYSLYIHNTGGSLELLFEWFNGGFQNVQSVGSGLTTGTLLHVAVTTDATTVKFYTDGQLVGQGSQGSALLPNNSPFQIGSTRPVFGNDFDGVIDELTVYNRALAASEIQAIFAAGSDGKIQATQPVTQPVPEPSTIILFATSLIGLLGYGWRKQL